MAASLNPALDLTADNPALDLDSAPAGKAALDQPGVRRSWKSRRWILGAAVLALLLATAGRHWWAYARAHIRTDNAFVAGDIHQISSRIAGTVAAVLVHDNQRVKTGTPLVELDPRDLEIRVDQAQSQLTQSGAQLAQADAQLQHARAQRAQTEAKSAKAAAELDKARRDFERAQRLTENERFAAISRQEFDAAKAAYEIAQASVKAVAADLQSNGALVTAAEAAYAVGQAQQRTARVNVADAELQRSYAGITAPVSGRIGRKSVEVGQRVQPGQALFAIVADQKWVVANFKETQLARMRIGQRVSIRLDAVPGRKFAGYVESFSPASGAQFALLPADNATGNFTKVVQRVPVKIVFDEAALAGCDAKIVPGLSAVVDVTVL